MADADFFECEVRELRKVFQLFDANQDGKLDIDDLRQLFNALGAPQPDAEILQQLLREMAGRGQSALPEVAGRGAESGIEAPPDILFPAFLSWTEGMVKSRHTSTAEAMASFFRCLDVDGDGSVTIPEIQEMAGRFGIRVADRDAHEMLDTCLSLPVSGTREAVPRLDWQVSLADLHNAVEQAAGRGRPPQQQQ